MGLDGTGWDGMGGSRRRAALTHAASERAASRRWRLHGGHRRACRQKVAFQYAAAARGSNPADELAPSKGALGLFGFLVAALPPTEPFAVAG